MHSPSKTGKGFRATIKLVAVLPLSVISVFAVLVFSSFDHHSEKTGMVRIVFYHSVRNIPLILDTATYKNEFGEPFTVTKFKYYVSNVALGKDNSLQKESESYHLIDARDTASMSFSFPAKAGEYHDLSFLLGVDSLRNCSGAQTGALDPMNDMFWTWNSGYVMAKLEGESDSSRNMHRIEYHIGGYKGKENVIQQINLHSGSPIIISEGTVTDIIIETDLAKWWQTIDKIRIAENPVCTTPGSLAKRISANYISMFAIQMAVTPHKYGGKVKQ